MADYNKFGRLIKINGGTTDASIQAGWSNYVSKQAAGNIVFADLHHAAKTGDVSKYPAGYYIWANGVEYKVANLEEYDLFYHKYLDYVAATNASIARIDTSVNDLEHWRKNLAYSVTGSQASTGKSGEVTVNLKDNNSSWTVNGTVKYTGSEYVGVGVDPTNSSAINVSMLADSMAWSTKTGYETASYRMITTKGYVDASLETLDTSIKDLSTRILDTVREVRMTASKQDTNNVSVALYETKEMVNGSISEVKKNNFVITGDDYVEIGATDTDKLTLKIHVNNSSIDSFAISNTSLSTTGVIKDYVDRKVSVLTGAIVLKGSVHNAADVLAKISGIDASKGNMWVADASFDYPATNPTHRFEPGDQMIISESKVGDQNASFFIVERNLDGAVTAKDDILTVDHVVLGNGNQTIKHTDYVLGLDASEGVATKPGTTTLTTEKAVHDYVEARVADISLNADTSSNYLNIQAKRTDDVFNVISGVNVATFAQAEASTNAGITLADANTFKHAIDNVRGTLAVAAADTTTFADSSALIALQMAGGNTSIAIKGGKYAIVEQKDASTLKLEVKASTLANASTEFEGLAIASDVSTIITANELATAAAFAKVKEAAGLTDNLGAAWTGNMATAFGANTSIIKAVEGLNASFVNASIHLNKRIDDLDLADTDTTDSITVGVMQNKGFVTVRNSSLLINGSTFKHTTSTNLMEVTLDGANISLGGADARWKAVKVDTAVIDLSTMIENVSTTFLKTVTGEDGLTPSASTYAEDAYVAITATATVANNTNLDTSVLIVKPVDLPSGVNTSIANPNGLVTDKYVADRIDYTLAWECY